MVANATSIRTILYSVARSLVCAVVGWLSGVLLWGVAQLILGFSARSSIGSAISSLPLHALLVAAFVLPVWLFFLLPLYTFVSPQSRLWRPSLCTALGAMMGAAILVCSFHIFAIADPVQLWFFPLEAAIVGAVTCLFGSLTHQRSHDPQIA